MNTSHTPLPFEDEPAPPDAKPYRIVVRGVQVWGLLCAALFLLALFMEAMRLRQNANPVRWREIVAWVSFDALFFLGAYAAIRFLIGGSGANGSNREQKK